MLVRGQNRCMALAPLLASLREESPGINRAVADEGIRICQLEFPKTWPGI